MEERTMNGSDMVWDWTQNDYIEGDRLVCATHGRGNPEYWQLCMYVRYGLSSWYLLSGVCTAVISMRSRRVRKQLVSVTTRPESNAKLRKSNINARKVAIALKLEQATILMQFAGSALMLYSALGTTYPPREPLGVISDVLFALLYASIGQMCFWARQASLHSRHLLLGNAAARRRALSSRSIRGVMDVAEQKLTPLIFGVMVVLVTVGVCTRYQLITVVFATSLAAGVALMHALLFTRLATIANVIRIHNHAGGDQAAVERRQSAVSHMVKTLVLELVVSFLAVVLFPLLMLTLDAHANSTRTLVACSVGVSLNCSVFTLVIAVRLKGQNRLKRKLQSVTTDIKNSADPLSVCTSSVMQIQSTMPVETNNRKHNTASVV
jgi:hypothetical protein